ncbi:MAG TPA: xanthine dehydrogenase family protein molybdopterin-binding subunit [Nocardioides sp.]|uniref:xanthine dehydrogenase family protein molybdopterin-binding subunit n=1 Tax=Nocardioides sp. TaxID=35761 RepID=UPI002F3FEB8C
MTELIPAPVPLRVIGTPLNRVDGHAKVTGSAAYAVEHPLEHADGPLHAWMVQSTVAKGRITEVDAAAALAQPGVVTVLHHGNAPRLSDTEDRELTVLQDDEVGFRGQVVACVVAESPEAAREGAALVRVTYDEEPHRVEMTLDTERYTPDKVNPAYPTDTEDGDVEAALGDAEVVVDQTYRTPYEHNNPMEPHATMAVWHDQHDGPRLLLYDSTQSVHSVASTLGSVMGIERSRVHVVAPHVGGGFGSKGLPHCHVVVAALAARAHSGRPVKLAMTRQQMFALAGYRTATIQRIRLGADRDGQLAATDHTVVEQTSAIKEFAEQTATITRMMYASPARRTRHRLVALDVAVPSWMRAPGEMPGSVGLEMAMDELAYACGVDPVVLRERNDTDVDPGSGKPFNNRRLVECLHRGAERFGWSDRPVEPRSLQDGEWWVGTGVASSTYPAYVMPGNSATVRALPEGRYAVTIGAVDIGTGAWTVLTQIAADALACPLEAVELGIGDSSLPSASVAGGSSGTSSWGSAIVAAAQAFREEHGADPAPGDTTTASPETVPAREEHSMHSFGAVFARARVHRYTGEIRIPRLLGVYSVGRVVNPTTARSQLIGGLTMGLGAALFEESYRDPRFGHVVTQDLATYHVAAHADVLDVDAEWLDEEDTLATPMGSRGIGEIGIVGTAAAVANATYHATGVRVRELPVTADRFL